MASLSKQHVDNITSKDDVIKQLKQNNATIENRISSIELIEQDFKVANQRLASIIESHTISMKTA